MNRCIALVLAAVTVFACAPANAQALKQQVVGTWTLASGAEKHDGKTIIPWAAGRLTVDAGGNYLMILVGKDRGKGNPNPRMPVGPFIAFYGNYTVDEAAKKMTVHIAYASSPVQDNGVRKFNVALSGDTMTLTGSPVKTPKGTIVPVNEWKRVK
jgi:hypothetical protein